MPQWTEAQADLIFKGEWFINPATNQRFKATAEPTIIGPDGKEIVNIPAVTLQGSHRTIRLPLGTLVKVEQKHVR